VTPIRLCLSNAFLAMLLAASVHAQQPPNDPWGGYGAQHGRAPSGLRHPINERKEALDRLIAPGSRRNPTREARERARARYAGDPTVSLNRLRHAPPPKAERRMARAIEAFQAGEEAEGVKQLEKAIEIHPEYIEAHNNLGVHYQRAGRYEEAAEQFAAALALDPSLVQGYSNMSLALAALGRFDEARDHARRGFELAPRSPSANYALAALLARDEARRDDAVKMFRVAAPTYPKAHLLAADLLLVQGKTEEARRELQGFLNESDGGRGR